MKCLNCSDELKVINKKNIEILQCSTCGGILLTQNSLTKMLPQILIFTDNFLKYHNIFVSDRNCLSCNINMKIIKYQNIILDYCDMCKCIWFDKNELQSTINYISSRNKKNTSSISQFSDTSLFSSSLTNDGIVGLHIIDIIFDFIFIFFDS